MSAMSRDDFAQLIRDEITDSYGMVPIAIDEAVERIADRYAEQVDALTAKAPRA
jgi:hypothetical protein